MQFMLKKDALTLMLSIDTVTDAPGMMATLQVVVTMIGRNSPQLLIAALANMLPV